MLDFKILLQTRTKRYVGITLDPNFLTNHFVYAYVGVKDGNTGISYSRVMRFTETENIATDPENSD